MTTGDRFLGLDGGASSAGAGFFDGSGCLVATAGRPIRIGREPGEIVEQPAAGIGDGPRERARRRATARWTRPLGSAMPGALSANTVPDLSAAAARVCHACETPEPADGAIAAFHTAGFEACRALNAGERRSRVPMADV